MAISPEFVQLIQIPGQQISPLGECLRGSPWCIPSVFVKIEHMVYPVPYHQQGHFSFTCFTNTVLTGFWSSSTSLGLNNQKSSEVRVSNKNIQWIWEAPAIPDPSTQSHPVPSSPSRRASRIGRSTFKAFICFGSRGRCLDPKRSQSDMAWEGAGCWRKGKLLMFAVEWWWKIVDFSDSFMIFYPLKHMFIQHGFKNCGIKDHWLHNHLALDNLHPESPANSPASSGASL